MALTLLEAAKLNSGDVIRQSVIELFAQNSEILRVLPFDDIEGNALKYSQEAALPGISFRGVNESFPESTGIINPQVEGLVIAGGDLDVDRFIIRTQGEGVRAQHESMKVKALAHGWTAKFIKGDSETNPREFDGLQKRVAGNLTFSKDEFGRRVTLYNDLPLLTAYEGGGGDEILPFNEAAAAGAATATSIYIMSITEGGLQGIQNGVMDVRDLGELQSAPVYRTRVEWFNGMVIYNGRAVSRVRHIGNLAIVA